VSFEHLIETRITYQLRGTGPSGLASQRCREATFCQHVPIPKGVRRGRNDVTNVGDVNLATSASATAAGTTGHTGVEAARSATTASVRTGSTTTGVAHGAAESAAGGAARRSKAGLGLTVLSGN